MSAENESQKQITGSPIALARDLQKGILSAKNISKDDRQMIVEYLSSEGCSAGQIADICKVNQRTIYRDRDHIRKKNAVSKDPEFTAKQVGQLMHRANQAVENLIRVSKDSACPHGTKVHAISQTWNIVKELNQMLQSIGYLPNTGLQINANIDHTYSEPPTFEQLECEVKTLELLLQQTDNDDENALRMVAELKNMIIRSSTSNTIRNIKDQINEGENND